MQDLKQLITNIAFDLGFDGVGITLADELTDSNKHFLEWREKGYAGSMDYLLRENPINAKPKEILKEAKTIISLLVNYYTAVPDDPGSDYGRVAAYAVGIDYHKVIRKKIKQFQERIQKEVGSTFLSKGYSDAVPLLEKSFAKNAGLGFIGRHTLVINKPFGSYFFIAELISNLDLEPTGEKTGTCGKCTRCIDICPTDALLGSPTSPPILDAKSCISYLTIENRGAISNNYREKIGEWIFGCDLCQVICPYNKKLKETHWEELKPSSGIGHWLNLKEVLSIKTDEEFQKRFARTPLLRPKRRGLLRNAAIVAGNRLSEEALPQLDWLSKHELDPVIKEHAQWALLQC